MPGPGRERETHAEGATEASQEGAEGHDAVAELIAEGILDLPTTGGQGQVELMWMKIWDSMPSSSHF